MQIAKRRHEQRQLLTRQKIIVGGVALINAKKSAQEAQRLAEMLRASVTRPADVRAIDGLLTELDQMAGTGTGTPAPPAQAPAPSPPPAIDPLAGLEHVQRRPHIGIRR